MNARIRRSLVPWLAVVLVLTGLLAACGDDDDDGGSSDSGSASDDATDICQASKDIGDQIRALPTTVKSIDDLKSQVNAIGDDVTELKENAKDEIEPEVTAVSDAFDDLKDTVGNLGSSASLSSALISVGGSLTDLGSALSDLRGAGDCS